MLETTPGQPVCSAADPMRAPPLAALIPVAACALLAAPAARAQTNTPDAGAPAAQTSTPDAGAVTGPSADEMARERAVRAYDRSHVYYSGGQYRLAISELENAIRIYPDAGEMYHELGLLYERIGQVDPAIRAYRRYRELTTDPGERERVERMIRRLEGARTEMYDIQTHHGVADGYFWGAAIAGVSGLATGAVLLGLAIQSENNADFLFRTGRPFSEYNGARQTAQTERTASYVTLGIGGTLAVTAAVLYFARLSAPRAVPVCVTSASGEPVGGGVLVTF